MASIGGAGETTLSASKDVVYAELYVIYEVLQNEWSTALGNYANLPANTQPTTCQEG